MEYVASSESGKLSHNLGGAYWPQNRQQSSRCTGKWKAQNTI